MSDRDRVLIEAVHAWAGDHEGQPRSIADAELLKALATYNGDHTTPCEGCDGECEEICAPATVAQQHAALDHFIAARRKEKRV